PADTLKMWTPSRLGFMDDIFGLATCIEAPNLLTLDIQQVLFCPVGHLARDGLPNTPCNLLRVSASVLPSCAGLRELSLIALDRCQRGWIVCSSRRRKCPP
ncbi:hypothetical protein R3P38DRAFT_2935489, partial [Favolaschia claudopus]